ncbi:MAG: TolC family protein [Terriglobia bacterium]
MQKHVLILLMVAIWSGRPGMAGGPIPASPEKLTLTQAVDMALANSPELRSGRERIAAAQAGIEFAKSRYRPQITFNGIAKLGLSGATNGLGLLGLPASPFWNDISDAVNVDQDIFDFGRTRHSVGVARAKEEAAEHDLDRSRIQVAERAKVAFLKVLSAQRLVQVREEDLKERQQVERKADEFFEVGLSSKLDLDLAQVGLRSAEMALAEAQDDQQAWAELFTALGQAKGQHYELVEPAPQLMPPENLTMAIDTALSTRPDLKAVQARIKAQQERVLYAQSLRRPILAGVFSGGYARFPKLTLARLSAGALGLFAPIYTGGGLKAQITAEQRRLGALRAQYASQVLEVRDEVSRNHANVLKALQSTEDNQKIAAYAEEALRLARTRYQAQLTSFVELITADAATEQARANYSQAFYAYQMARARLNASLGLLR